MPTHRSSIKYGAEGKAAFIPTLTDGAVAAQVGAREIAARMAAVRPHGSRRNRAMTSAQPENGCRSS